MESEKADESSLTNFDFKKITSISIHIKTVIVQTLCRITIFISHTNIYNNGIARRKNGENIGMILCDGKISKL